MSSSLCFWCSELRLVSGGSASLEVSRGLSSPPSSGAESVSGTVSCEHLFREDLAHPVVHPLAGAVSVALEEADPAGPRFLVRPSAAPVLERDPVVDAVQPQRPPREVGAQPDGLGGDPSPV